ncbi:MAG: hypothetical protein ABSE59_04975 [Opitutaceae bacterium]|jgi:hypothetical protein
MSQLPPDKITLEDLLHLKRAEHPPVEFWAQFDRELQAKQLAALVGKRPWWHSAARTLVRLSYLPLGATAALAFAFFVAHESNSPVIELAGSDNKLQISVPQAPPAPVVVRADAPGPQAPVVETVEKAVAVAVAPTPPARQPATPVADTLGISTAISWLANELQTPGPSAEPTLSASFADERIANQRLASSLAYNDEAKVRPAADPLTQVSSPSETQHARLIAVLTDARLNGTVDPVVAMHQRLTTRVGDEGLADDADRLGVDGDRVSIKF